MSSNISQGNDFYYFNVEAGWIVALYRIRFNGFVALANQAK